MFKHWAVFIDGTKKSEKILLNALGSEGRFRFEESIEDARKSSSLLEMIELCKVDSTQIEQIKVIARSMPIKSHVPGWNCQDYVLELFEALEETGIAPGQDGAYISIKRELIAKQDGLV